MEAEVFSLSSYKLIIANVSKRFDVMKSHMYCFGYYHSQPTRICGKNENGKWEQKKVYLQDKLKYLNGSSMFSGNWKFGFDVIIVIC